MAFKNVSFSQDRFLKSLQVNYRTSVKLLKHFGARVLFCLFDAQIRLELCCSVKRWDEGNGRGE
jgi:hypothetical protein